MTVYEMMVKQRKDQPTRKVYPERGEPWRLANERLKQQYGLVKHLDITEIDIGGRD